MHPFNYDITVRTQQLEIERVQRMMPPYDEFMRAKVDENLGPRRIEILIGRLARFFSPSRTRRAYAD